MTVPYNTPRGWAVWALMQGGYIRWELTELGIEDLSWWSRKGGGRGVGRCYGTHLYRCTIGTKGLVNDCNGGNYAGAYSHIYMWTPWTYRESQYAWPIRIRREGLPEYLWRYHDIDNSQGLGQLSIKPPLGQRQWKDALATRWQQYSYLARPHNYNRSHVPGPKARVV